VRNVLNFKLPALLLTALVSMVLVTGALAEIRPPPQSGQTPGYQLCFGSGNAVEVSSAQPCSTGASDGAGVQTCAVNGITAQIPANDSCSQLTTVAATASYQYCNMNGSGVEVPLTQSCPTVGYTNTGLQTCYIHGIVAEIAFYSTCIAVGGTS
jgi:hypothetical protein